MDALAACCRRRGGCEHGLQELSLLAEGAHPTACAGACARRTLCPVLPVAFDARHLIQTAERRRKACGSRAAALAAHTIERPGRAIRPRAGARTVHRTHVDVARPRSERQHAGRTILPGVEGGYYFFQPRACLFGASDVYDDFGVNPRSETRETDENKEETFCQITRSPHWRNAHHTCTVDEAGHRGPTVALSTHRNVEEGGDGRPVLLAHADVVVPGALDDLERATRAGA